MNACLLPSPFDRFALAAVLLLALASWGFVPNRALHSVAWMDAGSPNLRLASQGAEPYLEALIRRAGHWARTLVGQRPSETVHREP